MKHAHHDYKKDESSDHLRTAFGIGGSNTALGNMRTQPCVLRMWQTFSAPSRKRSASRLAEHFSPVRRFSSELRTGFFRRRRCAGRRDALELPSRQTSKATRISHPVGEIDGVERVDRALIVPGCPMLGKRAAHLALHVRPLCVDELLLRWVPR